MVRRNENQTAKILTGAAASAQNAWKATMAQMKGSMDRQTFSTLLGNAELLACEDGVYTVGMTNGFTRDWAEQRLSGTIEKILSGMQGCSQKVNFVVTGTWQPSHTEREAAEETPVNETELQPAVQPAPAVGNIPTASWPASHSTALWSPTITTWQAQLPVQLPKLRGQLTIRCSSTGVSEWARPICSMLSATV